MEEISENFIIDIKTLNPRDLIPSPAETQTIIKAFNGYSANHGNAAWEKAHFLEMPYGIAWNVGPRGRDKNPAKAIRYYLLAVLLGWTSLQTELTRTLGASYKLSKEEFQALTAMLTDADYDVISNTIEAVKNSSTNVSTSSAPTPTIPIASTSTILDPGQELPIGQGKVRNISKVNNAPLYTISCYDLRFTPPVRRRMGFRKAIGPGLYSIGFESAQPTQPDNVIPFFDSVKQAQDFITNVIKSSTSAAAPYLEARITDRPITVSGRTITLADCDKVKTDYGDAYMLKNCKYHEGLEQPHGEYTLEEAEDIDEKIEKHDELNPKLFDGEKLKPEVKDKVNELIELFENWTAEEDIELPEIKDIVIIGSNASYNYTEDSDLDVHIILDKVDEKQAKIYDLCRSNFNKEFDPEYYGVPVEIYVEASGMPHVSNGCYSIMNDEWVDKPDKDKIPEPNQKAIDDKLKDWEVRYNNLLDEINIYLGKDAPVETDEEHNGSFGDAMTAFTDESLEEDINNKPLKDIEKFIDDVYELRSEGINGDGEYDEKNLMFKEIRNRGYLDNLKDLKDKVISKELSLTEDSRYFGGKMPEPVDRSFEPMENDMEESWFDEGEDEEIDGYLVHNVPESAKKHEFIVARYSEDYEDLWYYGAWDDEDAAKKVANQLYNGKLIYRHGYDYSH